eukprot:UN16807
MINMSMFMFVLIEMIVFMIYCMFAFLSPFGRDSF